MHDPEVLSFLNKHLNAIQSNDLQTYHETTHEELSLYEWWITPQRIDGIPFHDFMMESNARLGTAFGVEGVKAEQSRIDLANLRIQRYADAAIASYTLLVSTATPHGVRVSAHNESRVMVKFGDHWMVVHVHKSPAYQAPHIANS